jgi:serine/threonine-protein kinase
MLGRVIDSKYKLLKYQGGGGMGTVYLAHRLRIGDRVAVKVLNPDCRNDATLVERFHREVCVAARSCDSRVIAIYDTGETYDGILYLVMPFIEAPTLREILDVEKRIPPERAVSVMLEVCGGVGAAHCQGIVHRDLKPENIMVLPAKEDRDREAVKVLDFGLAKPLNPMKEQLLTQPGVILGTPLYMSPEQYRGDVIDTRSDVYSLGVILYEVLTGQPPFVAYSLAELIAKHLLDAPKPIPKDLGISPALESVVMLALSKEPGKRQADARELAHALRMCLRPAVSPSHRNRWQELLNHFSGFFF